VKNSVSSPFEDFRALIYI